MTPPTTSAPPTAATGPVPPNPPSQPGAPPGGGVNPAASSPQRPNNSSSPVQPPGGARDGASPHRPGSTGSASSAVSSVHSSAGPNPPNSGPSPHNAPQGGPVRSKTFCKYRCTTFHKLYNFWYYEFSPINYSFVSVSRHQGLRDLIHPWQMLHQVLHINRLKECPTNHYLVLNPNYKAVLLQ